MKTVYTLVLQMIKDGEKTGMNGEDNGYTMKTDNMSILKPDSKKTYIPYAADGKIL